MSLHLSFKQLIFSREGRLLSFPMFTFFFKAKSWQVSQNSPPYGPPIPFFIGKHPSLHFRVLWWDMTSFKRFLLTRPRSFVQCQVWMYEHSTLCLMGVKPIWINPLKLMVLVLHINLGILHQVIVDEVINHL